MNIAIAKLVILAVLGLAAASGMVVLSQASSETDEQPRPVVSHTEKEPAADGLALRIIAKHRVARDVVSGRFSLLQGAALFGALNRMPPQSASLSLLDRQCSALPRTGEERLCRQVIEYVVRALDEEPDRQERALAGLEAEFWGELCRQGNLQLPNPSSLISVERLLKEAGAELAETQRGVIQGTKVAQPESPGELDSGPG